MSLHHLAQISDVVAAIHHHAADPRVVGVGAVILDVPGFVTELFEPEEVIHRLPGDAGQRHLADEMEEDDSAVFAHKGSGSELSVAAITCHTGLNFAEFFVAQAPRTGGALALTAWACPRGKTRARQGSEQADPRGLRGRARSLLRQALAHPI